MMHHNRASISPPPPPRREGPAKEVPGRSYQKGASPAPLPNDH